MTSDDGTLTFECDQRLTHGQYLSLYGYKVEEQSGSWVLVDSEIQIREHDRRTMASWRSNVSPFPKLG